MKLFSRKEKILPLPEGFTEKDIRTESSICTGETIIGFYDLKTKKLISAELVTSPEDIDKFYARYGLQAPEKIPD